MKMKNIFFFAFPMLFLGACNNSEKAYDATGIFEATEITVLHKYRARFNNSISPKDKF